MLCGTLNRGGAFDVAQRTAESEMPDYDHAIWVHKDFEAQSCPRISLVTKGISRKPGGSGAGDLLAAIPEALALYRFLKRNPVDLLHAHTRIGILASFIAGLLCGKPVVVHLHALARRTYLYRWLGNFSNVVLLANSHKTHTHYALPETVKVCEPCIDWPVKPYSCSDSGGKQEVNFITASEIVPIKRIGRLLDAWDLWLAEGGQGDLTIYGFSDAPIEKGYSGAIRKRIAATAHAAGERWTSSWSSSLPATCVYVHLCDIESFGLSLLQAFASGMRMVVASGTFLDEMPSSIRDAGIFRVADQKAESIVTAMHHAVSVDLTAKSLWEARRQVLSRFSASRAVGLIQDVYDMSIARG